MLHDISVPQNIRYQFRTFLLHTYCTLFQIHLQELEGEGLAKKNPEMFGANGAYLA